MGWLILLLLIVTCVAALRLFGVRGGALTAGAAALLFGAAGYALQGSPSLSGAPAKRDRTSTVVPLTQARHAFFGNFSAAESWVRISEALASDGQDEDSVGILQNAVRRYPGDQHLWIALGNALVDHAGGLTPAAELAYRRADQVLPNRPAPRFFYGLALARSGQKERAVELWREILAQAPADAKWRPLVEQGVQALSVPATLAPRASP
ncbi:MAG TPA: cytochrome C biosynthesis protein [Sphingomicrobium sp.]|jgi:cytochrome c-type biogenesis protein CcmH